MIDPIIPATQEQVEAIRDKSDLGPGCSVWSCGKDLVVARPCTELDPFFFAEGTSDQRKLMLLWGLEGMLRVSGIPAYYFNILESDEKFRAIVERLGAQPTSTAPEIRFKKSLL